MVKYLVKETRAYKTAFKKLSNKEKELTLSIINRLANDEILEEKYEDYQLKANPKNFRDCHIKTYLV